MADSIIPAQHLVHNSFAGWLAKETLQSYTRGVGDPSYGAVWVLSEGARYLHGEPSARRPQSSCAPPNRGPWSAVAASLRQNG